MDLRFIALKFQKASKSDFCSSYLQALPLFTGSYGRKTLVVRDMTNYRDKVATMDNPFGNRLFPDCEDPHSTYTESPGDVQAPLGQPGLFQVSVRLRVQHLELLQHPRQSDTKA